MYSIDHPWIAEREATVCTWKFDYDRGYVSNMNVSLLNDFMSLSARQLRDYAEMIKTCGFTGIQVMDICAAWRASGSWENVHDKFKLLADACHRIGLNFTVWVWAAEFSGHGWTDPEAVYQNADPSKPACGDPRVLRTFNKYYDIYADLAPYVDRVIAHFFDPGNLRDMPSIIYFVKLLAAKFRAADPAVKLAVDTWGCPEGYPQALVDAGMDDVMLMELPFLPVWRAPGKRAAFREGVKKLGCDLGVWGWYTADMEIDQLAMMTVNDRVLKDVFDQTRAQGDHVLVPRYWSEIDSYHILNFFSLYAAGHLLIDPEADPDRLLRESARIVTGDNDVNDVNTSRLTSVLELIRDARSGDNWDTYWWTEPGYILKNYDHALILSRVNAAVDSLNDLIAFEQGDRPVFERGDRPVFKNVLPVSRLSLYRLILPHLYQIRQYAEFSGALAALAEAAQAGADKEELQKGVDALKCDIPEYNCVTGLWGQPEARAAFERVNAFCADNGLTPPGRSAASRYYQKRRLVDRLTVAQRGRGAQLWVEWTYYEGDMLGEQYAHELLDGLCAEGVLVKNARGQYALAAWDNFRFDISE